MIDVSPLIALARKAWALLGVRGAIALAALIALPIHGCIEHREGYREGVKAVEARLAKAEAEALRRAEKARAQADKAAETRARIEAETRARDLAAIEEAKANDANPLDALF